MTSDLSAIFAKAKKVTLVASNEESISERKEPTVDEPEQSQENDDFEEDPSIINDRTIFVGNVPVGANPKQIKRLFSQFGNVEAVRFRNLVPANPKLGKRVAFIKKEIHPLQKSITAFVRFSDPVDAQSATNLNGFLFKEHHLRVDLAHDENNEKKHDNKRSIFIGNLPFDATDDDVWKVFEGCGDIEAVRLVRDRATSVGKGFGYVLFKDEASVALALGMNGNCRVSDRVLRVKTAVKKPKPIRDRTTFKKTNFNVRQARPMKKSKVKESKSIQQGRVEKRPAVKLRKEAQKNKKKRSTMKTNNTQKGVIQLKKKS